MNIDFRPKNFITTRIHVHDHKRTFSRPYRPIEPIEPNGYEIESVNLSFGDEKYHTIKEIIEMVITKYPDIEINNIYVESSDDFRIEIRKKLSEQEMEERLKTYKHEMKIYEEKMVDFKDNLDKYINEEFEITKEKLKIELEKLEKNLSEFRPLYDKILKITPEEYSYDPDFCK